MSTNVTKENLQEFATKLHAKNKTIFATKTDVGTPLVANTAAGMTDTTKIYVYTGSETGYTAGNWYYYNGSAWASGGVYNAEAIETDETLSISGMAADAKAVGDEFAKDLWGVPLAVREAIYTLLNSAAYATTGLEDEIAVVETWAEEVYSLTLSADNLSLTGNTPQALIPTVVPSSASVSWSSSDNSIATVNAGVVTGVSNGSCVITATAGNKSANCAVTVSGFVTLESITAVYTQGGTVYDTDSLDSLKSDLVVTAHYSDSSTATVTAYTLSGTLTAGTSTITVAYSGKTTTFSVSVTHQVPTYITDGLVMRLDGIDNTGNGHDSSATTWKDLVGNYDVSVPASSATWADDGLVFAGSQNRQIKCDSTPNQQYATIELVYAQSTEAEEVIAGFEIYSSGAYSRQIWHSINTGNNAWGVFCKGNSSKGYYLTSLNSLADIRTVSVIYSSYENVYKCFINGIEATETTGTASRARRTSSIMLGNKYDNNSTNAFHGKIMAVRYYNKQLTDAEVAQNHAADVDRFELEI